MKHAVDSKDKKENKKQEENNKNDLAVSCSYEDFLKYVTKLLDNNKHLSENSDYKYIRDAIGTEDFCKKIRIKDNAYIPHQIKAHELKSILKRQKNSLPDLLTDENISKIVSLLTFRIPYYVGPLSDAHSNFAWVERKNPHSTVKITPWNFNEEVDLNRSGEKFIERMISKCTYLKNEYVLPKQSILCQKFEVLNELNNLKINGDRISHKMKIYIYDNLCKSDKGISLSKKKIKDFLISRGKIDKNCQVGKENENDKVFNSNLSSLIQFRKILNQDILSKDDEIMCENIIKWHTVFSDEKTPVKERIIDNYKGRLNDQQIEQIMRMNFKGWSRLSEKFLTGITTHRKENEFSQLTIIDLLEKEEHNLIEILNSNNFSPKFLDIVKEINGKNDVVKFDYEHLVKDLYCSPIVKRPIWQAIQICKELAQINKSNPKKIFVEVTRTNKSDKKGKITSSRKEQIEALLKTALKDSSEYEKIMNELNKKNHQELRSDRLYLYFTQLGKCMYTGETINLADLNNEKLYDIDHIYPQSKIKDDSLNNRVLVKRITNANKSDHYPLDKFIRDNMRSFWEKLKNSKLISQEKFNRLICSTELTEEQIGGFVNRQLVSTNQAVKETIGILETIFKDTKVVFSKAELVSEFRNRDNHKLVKCREVNNLHHAHDAYLNIVVGNVWHTYYNDNFFNAHRIVSDKAIDKLFVDNEKHSNKYWKNQYDIKINDYLFNNKKYLNKFMVVHAPKEVKGPFYDQTIHPKTKGLYPLHEDSNNNDLWSVNKYGGYKTENTAYMCCIKFMTPNGAEIRGLYPVSVKNATKFKNNKIGLLKQICQENNINIAKFSPKFVKDKILMFSVLEIDGIRYYFRSKDLQCSADYEWYPDQEITQIIHDIVKFEKRVISKEFEEEKEKLDNNYNGDLPLRTRKINSKEHENIYLTKENNLKVYDALIDQLKKPMYKEYPFAKAVICGKISRNSFINLGTYIQIKQLLNIINNVAIHNGSTCDATKINGDKTHQCKCRINYKSPNLDRLSKQNLNKIGAGKHIITLISQSITGLFEVKIPLIF